MTRPVLPRLDSILQLAQVEPFDISPDHPRRMILPDQAIDIDRPQFDLIAHWLAHPRCAPRHCFGSWRRLFRQFPKQFVVSHHPSPTINLPRESYLPDARYEKYSHPRRVGKAKRAHHSTHRSLLDGG